MDPMETIIRNALTRAGIRFLEDEDNPTYLDFWLFQKDIHIEVKQFHSDRIAEQMSRANNVIVAQGRPAVEWLAGLIEAGAGFDAPHPSGESDPVVKPDWPAPAPEASK